MNYRTGRIEVDSLRVLFIGNSFTRRRHHLVPRCHEYGGEGPTVHDVCKTQLTYGGNPVFVGGSQGTDDLFTFTA